MRLPIKIWLYLSLAAIGMQSFTAPLIFVSFELNRDYIAATLCENRDIPESGCDGQCFLMKKLKQSQQDEGTERPVTKRESIWQFCSNLSKKRTLLPLRELLIAASPYQAPLPMYPVSIFHPPESAGNLLG